MLKQNVAGQKDAEQKRDQQKKDEKGTSIGTKTREQLSRGQPLKSDESPTTDQLIRQGQAQAKAEEEIQAMEVTTEEG